MKILLAIVLFLFLGCGDTEAHSNRHIEEARKAWREVCCIDFCGTFKAKVTSCYDGCQCRSETQIIILEDNRYSDNNLQIIELSKGGLEVKQ